MSDIVQEIINAADLASKWEPDHPQYVEGALYLTQAQWDAVRDQYPPAAERRHLATHAAWGIPVHIVKPDTIIDLPSGRVLVYSTAMDSFYTFDRSIADDAGLCSGVRRFDVIAVTGAGDRHMTGADRWPRGAATRSCPWTTPARCATERSRGCSADCSGCTTTAATSTTKENRPHAPTCNRSLDAEHTDHFARTNAMHARKPTHSKSEPPLSQPTDTPG